MAECLFISVPPKQKMLTFIEENCGNQCAVRNVESGTLAWGLTLVMSHRELMSREPQLAESMK
jgi:hypothetical protein